MHELYRWTHRCTSTCVHSARTCMRNTYTLYGFSLRAHRHRLEKFQQQYSILQTESRQRWWRYTTALYLPFSVQHRRNWFFALHLHTHANAISSFSKVFRMLFAIFFSKHRLLSHTENVDLRTNFCVCLVSNYILCITLRAFVELYWFFVLLRLLNRTFCLFARLLLHLGALIRFGRDFR